MRNERLAAWAAWALAACSPAAWGQTDGFREQIADRCRTESGCEQAAIDARRRIADCEPNAIGKIRCRDADADLDEVQAYLRRYAEKHQEDQRRERLAEERTWQELQREESARREAEGRARRLASEMSSALRDCERAMALAPCDRLATFDDDVRVSCLTDCALAVERAKVSTYTRAVRECIDGVASSLGQAKPDCRFVLPDSATDDLADRRDACIAECGEQAKPIVAQARAAASPPPTPKASGASSRSRGSGGGTRALCCDGTPSPTCGCGGGRGCCSHHGGVCGCTN
ncbi:MAG: hypothetical protein KF795_17875 [Labilithrix sp.]|nr:hypothetical protein [Labilithrix sp.]